MSEPEVKVEVVKEIKLPGGRTVKVFRDTSAANPRLGEEVRTRFLFLHKYHNLGDQHDYQTPAEIEKVVNGLDEIVLAPVFMLEEPKGKVLLDMEPFVGESDRCGQLGVMYINRESVEELFGSWSHETRVQALYLLEEDLRVYCEWLNDDFYGFILYDADGSVMVQETGYVGSDHASSGLYDDAGVELDHNCLPVE